MRYTPSSVLDPWSGPLVVCNHIMLAPIDRSQKTGALQWSSRKTLHSLFVGVLGLRPKVHCSALPVVSSVLAARLNFLMNIYIEETAPSTRQTCYPVVYRTCNETRPEQPIVLTHQRRRKKQFVSINLHRVGLWLLGMKEGSLSFQSNVFELRSGFRLVELRQHRYLK